MGKILVTGAAGFIGSQIALKLVSLGHFVVTVDNLRTGNISAIPDQVVFINGDCSDYETIKRLSEYKFDSIFHVAGQSSGEISFDDPIYDLQTNLQSTIMLLDYALKNGCKSFIYSSSMSVYGDQAILPVKEDFLPYPCSPYGVGKLASEHYLRIYSKFGINATALRLFNVFGPGQNLFNMRQGMVSIYIAQALKHGHIYVKGSAERFRDFIYIDDVVRAFITVYENYKPNEFGCYNICSSTRTYVHQLVDFIRDLVDKKITVQYGKGTPGDQFGIIGSYAQIENDFGWKPSIGLLNGLELMVNWAKLEV